MMTTRQRPSAAGRSVSIGLLRRGSPRLGLPQRGLLLGSLVASASVPGLAFASGFHIDEQDARASGRAGAVIASSNNASAVYYNPAGIADLSGVHINVGGALVRPDADFTSAADGGTTSVNSDNVYIPQAFVSWRASELVSLAVGAYAPFGLRLDWPETSPGRTNIRHADLRTIFIAPTFGLNLSRWAPGLSVGLGVDLVPSSVRLERDVLFGTDNGTVALDGTAFGIGGRLGVSYRPPSLPILAFGISYRSPVALDFSGRADFDAPLAYRASLPPDGDVETSVTLPQTVSAGVALSPVKEFELELDVNWRGWSSYDELVIELPDGSADVQPKDWNNSFTVRLGAEYTFDERWSVRAGGVWDQAPVPADRLDFQVPDVNRIDLAIGLGARLMDRVNVDLAGLWVLPKERSTSTSDPLEPPVKGRFEVDVLVISLTVGIQFDTPLAPPLDTGMDTADLSAPGCGAPASPPYPCSE